MRCPSGTCIYKRHRCDGRNDCADNYDESEELCGPKPINKTIRCHPGISNESEIT